MPIILPETCPLVELKMALEDSPKKRPTLTLVARESTEPSKLANHTKYLKSECERVCDEFWKQNRYRRPIIRNVYAIVESGLMSKPRLKFRAYVEEARLQGDILVMTSRDRFCRAELGVEFNPTEHEWQLHSEMLCGLVAATVLQSDWSERRLNSKKIQLGQQATDKVSGRPPKPLTRKMVVRILELRGWTDRTDPLGLHSIAGILRDRGFGISDRQVQAALNLEVPDGGGGFIRLMDIDRNSIPGVGHRIFLRLEKQGLIDELLAGLADDGQD